jgi:hypothetical protein
MLEFKKMVLYLRLEVFGAEYKYYVVWDMTPFILVYRY